MTKLDDLSELIRSRWCANSSGDPARWPNEHPAFGQCEATAQVVIERLGGHLVMGQVFLDGEFSEHHWWNRFDDIGDVDLTVEQFSPEHEIREVNVITNEMYSEMKTQILPEVRARFEVLNDAVSRVDNVAL